METMPIVGQEAFINGFPAWDSDYRRSMMIRSYRSDDRTAVLGLADELRVGVAAWCDAAAVATTVRGWVLASVERAEQGDGAVFVFEQGTQVVGLVTVAEGRHWTGERQGQVGELVVAPVARRSGAGAALMAAAEGWAAARGLGRLTLETGAANSGALGFYRALGYADEEVRLSRAIG